VDFIGRVRGVLAPRAFRVFHLRYVLELSGEEAAECLGISSGAVHSAMLRVRRTLRRQGIPIVAPRRARRSRSPPGLG
jgi:hypothetical protein